MIKTILLVNILIYQLALASSNIDGKWITNYVPMHGKQTVIISGNQALVKDDQNNCTLNDIGEPFGCTRLATVDEQGILKKELKKSGKYPRGTIIYKICGTRYGIVHFSNPTNSFIRLLKYDENDHVIYMAPLIMDESNTGY